MLSHSAPAAHATANGNVALVVNPSVLPVKTLEGLAASAKRNKLSYSSPGNGTPQHLSVELLKQRLGIDILHVPYKGAAQALTDLLGGQVHLAVLPVHTALPHAKAGKLNVIAVSGERRSVLAPDSHSFSELGLKNLDIDARTLGFSVVLCLAVGAICQVPRYRRRPQRPVR